MDMKQNEIGATLEENKELPKLPFKRLKYALNQVVNVGIPLHIQLLNEQSEKIENLKETHQPLELRSEQLKASKSVQLLKQDLFELEKLNLQVQEEDQDLFQKTIEKSVKDAIEVLSNFMSVHSDILGPFLDIDDEALNASPKFIEVVCNPNETSQDDPQEDFSQAVTKLQIKKESNSTAGAWSFLKRELIEIRTLIQHFSSLVFRQQESVDGIQSNILQTQENVREGTGYLKKASLLKAASFPIFGAVIGGLTLGPVGALAGFKLIGIMGCVTSGGVIGYTAGSNLKKKQRDALCNIEMKALTYPSKAVSASTPDLSITKEKTNEQR